MPSTLRAPNMTRSAILPHPHSQLPDPRTMSDGLPRGRSSRRDARFLEQDPIHRRTSRTTRHGANLVLMGAWALFGIGTLVGLSHRPSTYVGRVLTETRAPTASYLPLSQHPHITPSLIPSSQVRLTIPQDSPLHHEPSYESPSLERIMGRIFAWLCTTLYLTSRLPQIWKNFVRKSVEGLSIYLFVFAFLGNVFYVSSILTSPNLSKPPPISTDFMRESIPYLLGSAGTLMFDITIVAQSFIYTPKTRRHSTFSHTRVHSDEEASLLRDPDRQIPDDLDQSVDAQSRDREGIH
jgi:uncharacterized protein with PQ loop repeat